MKAVFWLPRLSQFQIVHYHIRHVEQSITEVKSK